jgi:phosphoenolpyruvate carboxylase
MTTNSLELNRIWNYYRNFVAGKADHQVIPGDITLKEWIGEFAPKTINVIPLIEDKPSLLSADTIVDGYIAGKELSYQRVFLARSDPAMTYGSTSAVLLIKLALRKLHQLETRRGIPIYPIVGLGSAPFRGNFKPTNVKTRLNGYPSVQTFTVQSAFKFDYPEEVVKRAIGTIKKAQRKTALEVDEAHLMPLIENISNTYSKQVERITGLINGMAKHVPARRKRRLHVGLFGYTRAVAGKRLPRAISFCASLYSMGIPPEILGLANLKPHDIKVIIEHYPNFMDDMQDAMMFYDPQALSMLPVRIADDIRRTVRLLKIDVETNLIHQSLVRAMRNAMEKDDHRNMQELVTQAARERRFLG